MVSAPKVPANSSEPTRRGGPNVAEYEPRLRSSGACGHGPPGHEADELGDDALVTGIIERSHRSSVPIACDSDGCAMCNSSAARPKFIVSTTARK